MKSHKKTTQTTFSTSTLDTSSNNCYKKSVHFSDENSIIVYSQIKNIDPISHKQEHINKDINYNLPSNWLKLAACGLFHCYTQQKCETKPKANTSNPPLLKSILKETSISISTPIPEKHQVCYIPNCELPDHSHIKPSKWKQWFEKKDEQFERKERILTALSFM